MAPECFACPEGDRLRWTDRLDIICLGRCSCTNQVSSVSLSVLCCQRMNISPVTQKKKKKSSTRAGCPSASPAASPHSLPADSVASDASSMADSCQLSSSTCHLAARAFSIWQPADSKCSDWAVACNQPQSTLAASSASACHCTLPGASDPTGPLYTLEGSNSPAWQLSSVFQPLVYTRPTLGSSPPVIGGAGLGSAASPSVGGAASQPALKAHQSLWRQASIGNIGSHLPPPVSCLG